MTLQDLRYAAGERPLVSVVMNCYNGEKYLREAIESVVAQTYANWEIVFWDNQSTDRSAEIFSGFDGPKFRYFRAPTHTFLYEARNYALEHVRGDLIAFLDVDDWWSPEKLAKQVPLFADPSVGLVCGNFWIENERTGTRRLRLNGNIPTGHIINELLRDYFIGMSTLVVRKVALVSLSYPCNPRLHIIGDFDLAIRLLLEWKLASVQEPVAFYRLHDSNESPKHRDRYVHELDSWAREMASVNAVCRTENWAYFQSFIAYLRAVNAVLAGERMIAFKALLTLPWGRLKSRLLLAICLPTGLARRWKK